MIEKFSALPKYLSADPPLGCFADTTVLFSFSYPLDSFNEESESVLDALSEQNISIFTNINVRAEFLENHRRVLIAECLIDFLEEIGADLRGELAEKLKSHRTGYRRKIADEKSAKMDVGQIKLFRKMLAVQSSQGGANGWEIFCQKYLKGRLEPIWPNIQEELNIHPISVRSDDRSPYLNSIPKWEDAVSLMGRYGLASSDAMILNMFLCSKIPVLLTADLEMADVAAKESKGKKTIFVPDSLYCSQASYPTI